jgi:hypothetical protein
MSTVIDGSASVTINSGAILGITSGTAVASTSGTSIDFTSIPSWVKRITVMFSGVSTSGTSTKLIQLGSTTFTTTGYVSGGTGTNTASNNTSSTTGMLYMGTSSTAAETVTGLFTICLISSNIWVGAGVSSQASTTYTGSGVITLGGTLDRIRFTTTNGTDTFDAGSINILYE